MSAYQIAAVAAFVLLAASVQGLSWPSCAPAPPNSRMFYSDPSINCTAGVACQTQFCACIGSSHIGNTACAAATANCTLAEECIAGLTTCMNAASDNTECAGLADLHLGLLAAETAGQWNTSAAYGVCLYQGCEILNRTAPTCSLDPVRRPRLCPSPLKFTGRLTFQGFFSSIDQQVLKANLKADLEAFLGFQVVVTGAVVAIPIRRQLPNPNDLHTLMVDFQVLGVNSRNSVLTAKLNNMRNSGVAVFPRFVAQYQAANNGANPIFLGVVGSSGSDVVPTIIIDTFSPTEIPPMSTPNPGSQGSSSSSSGGATSGASRAGSLASVLSALILLVAAAL